MRLEGDPPAHYAAFRPNANCHLRVPAQHGWVALPIGSLTVPGTMFACVGRKPSRPGAPVERSRSIYLEIRSWAGSLDSRGPRDLREHFPVGNSGQRAAIPRAV